MKYKDSLNVIAHQRSIHNIHIYQDHLNFHHVINFFCAFNQELNNIKFSTSLAISGSLDTCVSFLLERFLFTSGWLIFQLPVCKVLVESQAEIDSILSSLVSSDTQSIRRNMKSWYAFYSYLKIQRLFNTSTNNILLFNTGYSNPLWIILTYVNIFFLSYLWQKKY